jgi:hypothetical protein
MRASRALHSYVLTLADRGQGPDEAAKRRVHPAAIAHAERIARAQSMGMTLYGYKVFPDLTHGRAFMWGSLLAVYAVGASSLLVARSLNINSVRV